MWVRACMRLQKRAADPLELELQGAASCSVRALGTELRSFAGPASTLHHWATSPAGLMLREACSVVWAFLSASWQLKAVNFTQSTAPAQGKARESVVSCLWDFQSFLISLWVWTRLFRMLQWSALYFLVLIPNSTLLELENTWYNLSNLKSLQKLWPILELIRLMLEMKECRLSLDTFKCLLQQHGGPSCLNHLYLNDLTFFF